MSTSIEQTVAAALQGASRAYLEDVAAHGIHNVTNDYNGDSDEDYQAYSDEFERQSKAALDAIIRAEERGE